MVQGKRLQTLTVLLRIEPAPQVPLQVLVLSEGVAGDIIVFLDEGVEAILDFVLRTAGQLLADLAPLAPDQAIQLDDLPVFLVRPLLLLDLRVQLVYEPLPDLLACLAAHQLRQHLPVFTHLLHRPFNPLVLLGRPDFATDSVLRDAAVAVEALVFVAVAHEGGDEGPALGVLLVEGNELLVLLLGPGLDSALLAELVLLFDLEGHFVAVGEGFGENCAWVCFHALFIEENKL